MSEKNLYQKIVEVRKVAEGFSKDGSSYGYTYVTGNQVLGKIKDKMNELNLLLIPSTKIGEHHTHAYKTAKGKDVLDFVVKGEMSYTWINGDEPAEREVISWAYYGQQDDISKAFGSALTYSERYFLLKCLGLPTDEDDPDAKPEKPAYQAEKKPFAEESKNEDLAAIQRESEAIRNGKSTSSPPPGSEGNYVTENQSKMLYGKWKSSQYGNDKAVALELISAHLGKHVTDFKYVEKPDINEVIKWLDTNKAA